MSGLNSVLGYEFLKRKMKTRFGKFISKKDDNHPNLNKPHGIVLTGPPGVGKSYFCECLLDEYVNGNELFIYKRINKSNTTSKDNNMTAGVVTALFDEIRDNQSQIYILHIEEADDIFMSRQKVNRSHANELTTAWIDNMEGNSAPPNYYILATTNYMGRWDAAITDRFEYIYHVDLPDPILLYELYKNIISNEFRICQLVDKDIINWAKLSHILTGRDIVKIAQSLDDLEYEIQEIDPNAILTVMSVHQEIVKRKQNKKREILGYKENMIDIWGLTPEELQRA